jgi:hypothetical protein
MQLDKREFRRSIDGDKKMELAFFGPHFGNVDVEEADRIGFELLLRRLAPLDIRRSHANHEMQKGITTD